MLGWPNLADGATLSGGTWASAPFARANMQSSETALVARTTGITTAATQFQVDFGAAVRLRARVEVTTRDGAKGISTGQHRQTEGKRDTQQADTHIGESRFPEPAA